MISVSRPSELISSTEGSPRTSPQPDGESFNHIILIVTYDFFLVSSCIFLKGLNYKFNVVQFFALYFLSSRVIDVFMSRLHPMTTAAEVEDCVKVIKGDNLHVEEVQCEKRKARYEHLYSSFSVQIRVNSIGMKRALDLFMHNESWPCLLYTSPSPRDRQKSRMPSSA